MIDTGNHRITKTVDGWNPPDTDELKSIIDLLDKIGKRIHSLRIAFLLNNEIDNARIHKVMASRKAAIEKAYKMGLRKRRRKYRHA